jgi:hypothetical protein
VNRSPRPRFRWFLPTGGDDSRIDESTHGVGIRDQRSDAVRAAARQQGRSVRFGIRLHVTGLDDATVAARISEYHDLGIDEFIFSGYPHLEEAYRFGEGVLSRFHS